MSSECVSVSRTRLLLSHRAPLVRVFKLNTPTTSLVLVLARAIVQVVSSLDVLRDDGNVLAGDCLGAWCF